VAADSDEHVVEIGHGNVAEAILDEDRDGHSFFRSERMRRIIQKEVEKSKTPRVGTGGGGGSSSSRSGNRRRTLGKIFFRQHLVA
jgi:hypothetical protein